MKKRILIFGLLTVVAIGFLGLKFWLSSPSHGLVPQAPKSNDNITSEAAFSKNAEHQTSNIMKVEATNENSKVLRDLAQKRPAAQKFLQDATATGNKGNIHRAFNDVIHSNRWPMSEVIPALKSFLNNSDPYVRLNAAHDLFVVGDQSGYDTLIALVQSQDPIPELEGGLEARVEAATILAQFHQVDAATAISDLYVKAHNEELSQALANLGVKLPGIDQLPFVSSDLSITEYAKTGITAFLPQITSTFQNSTKSDVKAAAAWALATMTNDQDAINYLIQAAQSAINTQPDNRTTLMNQQVIKYLGTVQTPAAKQTLEEALDSSDTIIVQNAIVNLIFNQGGSDKAVQILANQLNDSPHATLPWDFTLTMVAQLLDNPQIQAAGQKFSQYDPNINEWQLYTVERKNWSIFNWVGNYIVKLNK